MLLTLVVSMLTIGTRFSVSPAQTGVALSYILSIQLVGQISLRIGGFPEVALFILVLWLDGPTTCRG